jgi:hypothetical protein
LKRTAVSIIRRGDKHQAAALSKRGETYELQLGSTQNDHADWDSLCTEMFGQNILTAGGGRPVIGYDCGCVAFYRLDVPAVKEDELQTMIALQTEALLPLPIEEMDLAWRVGTRRDGKFTITIAAARKRQLEAFDRQMRKYKPARILLADEAIVKGWQTLFTPDVGRVAIIYLDNSTTQVCLVDEGKLVLAVTLDVGRDDLITTEGLSQPSAERLVQDIRNSMERFGGSAAGDLKIYVLADGSAVEQITEYLSAAGLNAQTAMVEMAKLKSNTSLCRKEIYEYLVAIGLALMELDEDGRELDLFERLRAAGEEKQKKRRVPSLKLSAAIVLIMLAAFTLVSYGIDVARLRKIETALGKVEADIDINQLEKEHQLKKVVARQRADVLELLSLINTCRPEELMLDSVSFNKKQPVAVTGHTKDKAKIYEFRKNLQKQADIKTVRPQSSAASDKKEDISFTITFIYKNFGKK